MHKYLGVKGLRRRVEKRRKAIRRNMLTAILCRQGGIQFCPTFRFAPLSTMRRAELPRARWGGCRRSLPGEAASNALQSPRSLWKSLMAIKPKVFVTRILPDAGLKPIKDACDAEVWADQMPPPAAVLRQKVAAADGLVSLLTDRIDAALLDAAPRLKIISNFAVGFNNIDVPACTERGICVGNTPGVLTDATADMAFCLLIAAARCVVEGHQYTVAGKWRSWEPLGHLGQDLAGRTLGVVGMGRIGYALAKRCRGGWDMNILYHDVQTSPKAESDLGARRVDLDTLLAQ